MCGIGGFIDFNKRLNEKTLDTIIHSMKHRGPDGSGKALFDNSNFTIGLGHSRLAIIDLSEGGAQPQEKDNIAITFNGEIYNYKEIKVELENLGHTFSSQSDTEVIISAYKEWGINCLEKFIGIFSIVLFDKSNDEVYLIRDRAGVKPLYIYYKNNTLVFGSEMKPMLASQVVKRELDEQAIIQYFMYGYIPTPYAIYKDVEKVKQGHYLKLDLKTKEITEHQYWNVFDYTKSENDEKDMQQILDETESLLHSAFNYRMVSDVPVGIFLSGGYDSSLVTAILQKDRTEKVNTFTVGFDDPRFDESGHAKKVAIILGTNHTEWICTIDQVKDIIQKVPEICDEPFGDNSIIPTYLVSKMAKQKANVVLSADGGDEQFVGYRRYINAIKIGKMLEICPSFISKPAGYISSAFTKPYSNFGKISRLLIDNKFSKIPLVQNMSLTSQEVKDLMGKDTQISKLEDYSKSNNFNDIFATEYTHYMQDDIMVKVDRATMAVGLEGREPFLDHRIAEYIMGLPIDKKYHQNTLKYILKQITHKYIPKDIMERPKKGFSMPVKDWMKTDLKDLVIYYLSTERITKQGLFSSDFINNKLLKLNNENCNRSTTFIWHMLCFQMWYDRWMTQNRNEA